MKAYAVLRRTISTCLAALMLTAALAACAQDDVPPDNDNTDPSAPAVTTPAAETEDPNYDKRGYLRDSLPDTLNFGNTDFNFLAWKQGVSEYFVEAATGDVIDNAIYARNQTVEERLGVKLNFQIIPGNSGAFRDFCATAMNSINANTQTYDAIACYLRSAGVLTLNHMLLDMNGIDHLDFEKPWWSDSLLALNTINDKLYFISGDIATSLLYQMMFMIYNDQLGGDLGLTNPQQLALDGKWTHDALFTMAAGVYADLDGNGTKSEGDRFGLFSVAHPNLDIFYMGADLHYIEPNAEGTLVLSADYFTEKSMGIIDRLNSIYWASNDGWYNSKASGSSVFSQGNSLFYNVTGQQLSNEFRGVDFAYSILPAPKYDEKQENYLTCVAFTHSMYCVPLDAKNTEMTGAVLECLASEGYRTVSPALFDTAFKYQYSNNENDSLLFDVIRQGVVFDIGRAFFDELGGDDSSPIRLWRNQITNNRNTLTSAGKALQKRWETVLANMATKLKAD